MLYPLLNSPSKERLQKFKTYKNKLNMLIRKSKRSHFFTKFELAKNDMKKQSIMLLVKVKNNPYIVNSRMSVAVCLQTHKIFRISLMISL